MWCICDLDLVDVLQPCLLKKARPSLFRLLLGSPLTSVPVVAGSASKNQECGRLQLLAIKEARITTYFLVSH